MNIPGTYRTWAEIDLSALAFNLRRIRSLNPKCEVIGVIKADAYGHGMFAAAQTLGKEGVRTFAVANFTEAQIALRAVPKNEVLLLGSVLPEEIPLVVQQKGVIPTLSNLLEFRAFEKCASRKKRQIKVHVKLDTGMGRLGSFPDEALSICEGILKSKYLELAGIYTHLSSADVEPAESLKQLRKLRSFCQVLIERGIRLPKVHFQNSAGTLFQAPDGFISSVRPGLGLYGVPIPYHFWKKLFGSTPLKPVLSWKSRIVLLKDFPKGATISYCKTYQAKKQTRVAVLSVGYADGVYRKLSNRGEVLVRGVRCKILGRVTMDLIMVDVSRVRNVRWGDPAVLIGKSGSDEITVSEVSHWAETNPYETLCAIGKRVIRIPFR
jgi:alanine racemase